MSLDFACRTIKGRTYWTSGNSLLYVVPPNDETGLVGVRPAAHWKNALVVGICCRTVGECLH